MNKTDKEILDSGKMTLIKANILFDAMFETNIWSLQGKSEIFAAANVENFYRKMFELYV